MLHHFHFIIVYTSIVLILWSQDACLLFIIISSVPEVTKHCVYVIYTRIDECTYKGAFHTEHTHTSDKCGSLWMNLNFSFDSCT